MTTPTEPPESATPDAEPTAAAETEPAQPPEAGTTTQPAQPAQPTQPGQPTQPVQPAAAASPAGYPGYTYPPGYPPAYPPVYPGFAPVPRVPWVNPARRVQVVVTALILALVLLGGGLVIGYHAGRHRPVHSVHLRLGVGPNGNRVLPGYIGPRGALPRRPNVGGRMRPQHPLPANPAPSTP
jgi:hypothetical protein